MDGAGPLRIAWHVKLPLVRPALVLTTVFTIIGTLQLFAEPLVLNRCPRSSRSPTRRIWSGRRRSSASTGAQLGGRTYVCGYTFWVYKDYKRRRGYNYEYKGTHT